VACNDIDTYKEDVRNKLRQWIAPLQEREMEYLILYVNNQAKKSGTLSLLTRSVLHSLHNDFKSKIDRYVSSFLNM
jgi:tRNA(Ile)-lysidine synthase TilS/MesJ